jgi:TolA-binding protein
MRQIFRCPLVLSIACIAAGCGGAESISKAPSAPSLTPKIRAAMELNAARKMEKLKQKRGAIEEYQRIGQEFPETPEAKVAAERIKALGGK